MTSVASESGAPPSVTALIDTYNYGRFIEQAIESVLAQDYPSDRLQVLVVDDGSTDDTAERVKKYRSRVQYLCKPNGGQASAFNFGFEKAKGDIVAFLDADDYWLPGKLSKVVRAFTEHPGTGLVYHRRKELDSSTGQFVAGDFASCSGFLPHHRQQLLDYRVLPTSSLAFSRQALTRIMHIPEFIRLQADAYMALLVVFLAPVEAIAEDLCVYRLHGGNLFATDNRAGSHAEKHLAMRQAIFEAAQAKLQSPDFDQQRAAINAFFEQLFLFLVADKFKAQEPSRLDFFRYMRRRTSLYWEGTDWKLKAMNAFNTLAAPMLGYSNFSSMYRMELRVLNSLHRILASKHS